MSCEEHRHNLELYLDEELEGEDLVAVEEHFAECPGCFEYVRQVRAFRSRVRAADAEVALPPGLRPDVVRGLNRADRRVMTRRAVQALPLVAAAAVVAIFFWRDLPGVKPLVEPIVAAHATNMPMEVEEEDPQKVERWFRGKVPFAVRPPRVRVPEVRLLGARLAHLRERPTAYLTYQRRGEAGSKYSLFVFNQPETELQIEGAQVREVRNRQVYLAHRRGFAVVLWQERQLVYSLASEAGDKELLSMAGNLMDQ